MTGSGTKIQAGSLGNIKDLVRKANETATDRGTWRGSFNGRAGGGRPPDKKATEQTADQKLTQDEPKKEQEKPAASPKQPDNTDETTQTQAQDAAAPAPSKPEQQKKKDKPGTKPISARPPQKGKNAYKNINRQVSNFDAADIKGSRHWVFISEKNLTILNLIYGERRLSAILNVLAERHIEEFKDDMIRSITDKSGLLQE